MLESSRNPAPTPSLPEISEVESILGFSLSPHARGTIEGALLAPLRSFVERPSKGFRSQLAELGMDIGGGSVPSDPVERAERLALASKIVEAIHAGSLVVDDIEDGSEFRRGEPALHRRYGVGVALNAANWLYFWPFERVRGCSLAPEAELQVYRICQKALLLAHFGQALDLGTCIDEVPRAQLREVCFASLTLKTGALAALACGLGALLGGAIDKKLDAAIEFGKSFGIALQMFDDLGNFLGADAADPIKRFEDLRLRRPSWVWVIASELGAERDATFGAFTAAVETLPDTGAIEAWIRESDFKPRAVAEVTGFLDGAADKFLDSVEDPSGAIRTAVRSTIVRLTHAYI